MTSFTHISATLILFVFLLVPSIASAQEADEQACRALADLYINDTNLLSAVVVPTDGELPEYCRVLGYVRPAINFEIRLPTSSWNGKFYMGGCGGACGRVNPNEFLGGLRRNYAVSTTDTGHWGANFMDDQWAYHNLPAKRDWAHRGIHETARVTKAVIEAYYGRSPAQSYFQGCSNGGRQANMEAWRYPEDFEGIISGAPDLDYTGFGIFLNWVARANTSADNMDIITAADAQIVGEAVYAECDEVDGIKDGLIEDPRNCSFDIERLACRDSMEKPCLTQEQVEALKSIYALPRNSSGELLYPGAVPYGSEPYWGVWLTGPEPRTGDEIIGNAGLTFLRYLAFEDDAGPEYDRSDFDFDEDPKRTEYAARLYNSDNPNLETFRSRGGKLLMWHGWADPIVPPAGSIDYYEGVEQNVGGRDATQDFLRLFMIPGMDHCGIQEGPGIRGNGFDPLTALEKWVEQGDPPAQLITTKRDTAGVALWERPVCPYPKFARYKGNGDVNVASSFECVDP